MSDENLLRFAEILQRCETYRRLRPQPGILVMFDALRECLQAIVLDCEKLSLERTAVGELVKDPRSRDQDLWKAADVEVASLKTATERAQDEYVPPDVKEFRRQQELELVNAVQKQSRIETKKNLRELRKQPGYAKLKKDPRWKPLDNEFRSTYKKFRLLRARWHGKSYHDLSPQEQLEEGQLTIDEDREMSDLRWRLRRLSEDYHVHSPDLLRTPDGLASFIRVALCWAKTPNMQDGFAIGQAAKAREAATNLRLVLKPV